MNYYQPQTYYGSYLGANPYAGNMNNQLMAQANAQPYNNQLMQNNQVQPQVLNGKIVDGIDVVKGTEVPFGSYGIFPKADFSEIYIKTWNNNGTTRIMTFDLKPESVASTETQNSSQNDSLINEILSKINGLETKIDDALSANNSGKSRKEYNNAKPQS